MTWNYCILTYLYDDENNDDDKVMKKNLKQKLINNK